MKLFQLCVLALALSGPAQAQLMFKNTKTDTFQLAVVMQDDMSTTKTWTSKGWFRLLPGDSASVGNLVGTAVYYFLHTTDNKISTGGTKAFLVDKKDAFSIKKANEKSTEKKNPAYIWRDFHEMQIPDDSRKAGKFMIIL